jgi:Xaa-Pro aminopeptidase
MFKILILSFSLLVIFIIFNKLKERNKPKYKSLKKSILPIDCVATQYKYNSIGTSKITNHHSFLYNLYNNPITSYQAKSYYSSSTDKHTVHSKKMNKIDTTARLEKLRELMKKKDISAYIIPTEDAHQSEYISDADKRREFISGFNGSAGIAIVTQGNAGNHAALWTDGRYHLQASKQLDSNWTLMKSGLPDVPTKEKWLIDTLPNKAKVAIDAKLISVTEAESFSKTLSESPKQLQFVTNIKENLVDQVWTDQPAPPNSDIIPLGIEYTGKSLKDKLADLRKIFEEKNIDGYIITALDEIAWLFNMRGSDVEYNPVFYSFAAITKTDAVLYTGNGKVSKEVSTHLGSAVRVRPYNVVYEELKEFGNLESIKKLWVSKGCNLALYEALGGSKKTEIVTSPLSLPKAIKNEVELKGFRECNLYDISALVKYFAWLENELCVKNNTELTEFAAAEKLEEFRSKLPKFMGLSFETISSTGPNGAIIHYSPTKEQCSIIDKDQFYLCDSGGQYLNGTCDVTRTLHFGQPSDLEKDCYTRVLQGHIGIDTIIFPNGTTGYQVDCVARKPLWEVGLDYLHGTGHGVGHFLNVHEGPQGFGSRPAYNTTPLKPGMIVTNEPGFYLDGQFGIRIESMVIIVKKDLPNNFANKDYYGCERITFFPIQTKCCKKEIMTQKEIDWVNQYNKECWEKISPLIQDDQLALDWLKRETQPF